MAYMPQEESRPVSKYGTKDTYNKGKAYSNGGSEMGYLKGYQDSRNHPVSYPEVVTQPYHTHTPEDSFETKTTESRVPMVTHDRPREDEFIQTEVSRPIKPRPIGNLYWWETANYNAYGGSNYGRSSDPGTDIYNKARVNGTHQPNMDGLNRKSEFEPEDRQDYRISTTDDWTRPRKPTTDVAAPTQGRLPPPVLSRGVAKQPAIDSNKAARRFGAVVAIAPVEPTSIIDSREAAWKYRGQRV